MKTPHGVDRNQRFESLYRKYYWKVVRFYVQTFRLAEEDARDLAQDAFVRFYKAMDEYRGDAEWAFFEAIARNVAYNRIRSTKTQKRSAKMVDIDDPEALRQEPAAPQGPDYADQEEAALRHRKLHQAIAALTTGQQECIRLQLEGFTYDDIAKALRISVDAVKSRIRDAKRLLRARLGDVGTLPEDQE